MEDKRFVYVLRDADGEVRYVGSTKDPSKRRISIQSTATPVGFWIYRESKENRIVTMEVVHVSTNCGALLREKELIAEYAQRGCRLLNASTFGHAVKIDCSNITEVYSGMQIQPKKVSTKAESFQPPRDKTKHWRRIARQMAKSQRFRLEQ